MLAPVCILALPLLLACDATPTQDPLFAGPTVCTSDNTWDGGNARSSTMRPGHDCAACHVVSPTSPELVISGTVYPTGHEPDDCYGVDKSLGIVVEVTDATGRVYALPTNTSGNFFLSRTAAADGFVFPYTARVLTPDGRVRSMPDPQAKGSCNACHSETGNDDAPGRIVAPP